MACCARVVSILFQRKSLPLQMKKKPKLRVSHYIPYSNIYTYKIPIWFPSCFAQAHWQNGGNSRIKKVANIRGRMHVIYKFQLKKKKKTCDFVLALRKAFQSKNFLLVDFWHRIRNKMFQWPHRVCVYVCYTCILDRKSGCFPRLYFFFKWKTIGIGHIAANYAPTQITNGR